MVDSIANQSVLCKEAAEASGQLPKLFNKKFFFLDVESIGLHGDPFAVAVVITNEEGTLLDEFCWSVNRKLVSGKVEDRKWVDENVPDLPTTHASLLEMCREFWNTWKLWKGTGAVMVCDCPWPVEARFLNMCKNMDNDNFSGPYPLLDLSSMLYTKGFEPLGEFNRLTGELPKHHPLCDVRQTKRLFFELQGVK